MTTFVSFNSELNINNAPVGRIGDQAVLFNNDSYAPHRGYQMYTWRKDYQMGRDVYEGWFPVCAYEAYKSVFRTLIEYGLAEIRSGEKRWSFEDCKFL